MTTTTSLDLATAAEAITSRLRETGLVRFTAPAGRAAFASLASSLLVPAGHPDAGPDGITEGRPRPDGDRPGRTGFTRQALRLHTERSGTPAPPHLLMLLCVHPGSSGGETVLADGAGVFAHLAERAPAALEALSARGAAHFGGACGHSAPVLERAAGGRWSIRLRLDGLASFSPRAQAHLPALTEAVQAHPSAPRHSPPLFPSSRPREGARDSVAAGRLGPLPRFEAPSPWRTPPTPPPSRGTTPAPRPAGAHARGRPSKPVEVAATNIYSRFLGQKSTLK
ncbi:TauD/TfdA family dioxygenase [Nocardiopsis sp. CNT-189]|uniref:TauD/TfdA family dioxygenase n=1 Tax=Nocardiopsis oceanisediminis TaxID=2816862 RepID=UPI003B356F0A